MAGKLREVRRRIRSVKSTQKITRAMELIAASRIVKATARTHAAKPYADEISKIVAELVKRGGGGAELLTPREGDRVAVIAVTADRGLAGAYNTNVLKLVEAERRRAGADFSVYSYGRKALSFYKFRKVEPLAIWQGYSDTPPYTVAKEIGRQVTDDYLAGRFDKVLIAYTSFQSMLTQTPVIEQLLPVLPPPAAEQATEGLQAVVDFEPDAETILDSLLPRYVESRVFSALLNAAASEHAARRRAMKAATDNADEIIKILTRDANRARQAEITTEISEIVGGAEALAAEG
ncbi:MAG: F-type H+-transporting ATPase subunit gamma [Frankiaceae bacterium]|jgi:F-type H+-transporting ATPase subunit gamma|nr:F-type H+-transporting ATPase subunit gamma [Frankiaceae bacterium]